jgi:signal transduction histidine kinase
LPSQVRISVSDTGPGIPAEERDRVTDRFVRLGSARDQPGNGLGLPLVKAVAEQHGGKLIFEDNLPGLTAILELPCNADIVASLSSSSSSSSSRHD